MSEPLGTRIRNFVFPPEQMKQLREALRSRKELKKKMKKAKTPQEKSEVLRKHRFSK